MTSKRIYMTSVIVLILLAVGLEFLAAPKDRVEQQHLTYNTSIKDHNLSVQPDTFSSKLPVVSIRTSGQVIPGKPEKNQHISEIINTYITADVMVFEKEGTLHQLKDKPDISEKAQIRVRGNSSREFDKSGYLLKFIEEDGEKKNQEIMGMEEDDTWILHGPFLDKTLLRNYMWYNLSGMIMEWAPEVGYCEVFVDDVYQGIYVMTEQIAQGEGRINVSKYDGKTQASSYILSMDRESVNDVVYLNNFTQYTKQLESRLEIKYPGKDKINPEIIDYIEKDFSKFEKALYSYDFDSDLYGYSNYIDVNSFVDYFLINEITQNTDAGLYSTYLYKDVSGKLKLCVWDFNNCADNYMEYQQPMEGFTMHTRPWFFMLMKDEAFVEQVIKRYKELRKDMLSDDAIKGFIEDSQKYLGTAVERNFQVWGYTFEQPYNLLEGEGREINSYEDAIRQYERRLISRMGWLDKYIEVLYGYCAQSATKMFHE